MLGELVRIKTEDSLELQGILFEPEKSDKALIHIHGWTGNFYENVFIDYVAKEAVSNGFAFLSFNTRGAGHIQEFLRKQGSKTEYVKIGGSLEKFEESVLDLKAATEFLNRRGYKIFVLEGHSTGCQKAVFYKYKTKDEKVKGLVLLEPTDDPSVAKRFLGERYGEAMEIARKMAREGSENDPVPDWVPFGIKLSARKFLSMSDPDSTEGRLFNYSGKMEEIRGIDCPVLAIFGSGTEYQEGPGEKLEILKKTIKNCETSLIRSNHWFSGHETELAETISVWLIKKGL